ncbi:MAG: tartrate-resistant acid phosphatase type 5 family protein [Bacteroidota bacterium]
MPPPRLVPLLVVLVVASLLAACGSPMPVGQRVPEVDFRTPEAELPAPLDTSAFNYLILGDWGRNGFFNQAEVAAGMGRVGEAIQSRFTISTGDNFYTSGVTSVDDVKWERSYERIYTAPSLQSRWYVTLGNHDWQGNVPAQIEYTALSDRWYMPAQYFAEEMIFGADSTRVLFVFIDSSPIAYPPAYEARFSDTGVWAPGAQLDWIETTLRESDAEWKIVVGHHPIYVGSVRYSDNQRLIERLVPIFERYGVQAHFAGHDHNLQHHRPEGSPVDYFVSGAGSLLREVIQTPNTLFAVKEAGFMAASMTRDLMIVKAFDEDGDLLYRAEVPRRRGERLPLPFGTGGE